MVDAREAAHDAASKLMSKSSRWRTKIFSKDDAPAKPADPKPSKAQLDDDVSAFLKPSTDRAAAASASASASAAAAASRPRIDIARAQRWPAAQDILNSAAAGGKSPGPGGLRTGTRKKGLSVSFVRAVPDVIGHGGDECEEPAAEVSRRKKATTRASPAALQPLKPQDDAHLGTGMGRTPSQTEQRNSLTRTLTSHKEQPRAGPAAHPPARRADGAGRAPQSTGKSADGLRHGAGRTQWPTAEPRLQLLARLRQRVPGPRQEAVRGRACNPRRGREL
jgi:hypothetical protein